MGESELRGMEEVEKELGAREKPLVFSSLRGMGETLRQRLTGAWGMGDGQVGDRAKLDARTGLEAGFLPPAMTLGEFFAHSVIESGVKKAPPLLQKILLTSVLRDFDFDDSQKAFLFFEHNFVGFLETSPFLFELFAESFASGVGLKDMMLGDIYGEFEDHLQVLIRIYEEFEHRLKELGYCDFLHHGEIFWDYLQGFGEIELHIDGVLSHYEWRILREIAGRIPVVLEVSIDLFNHEHFAKHLALDLKLDHCYRIALSPPSITLSPIAPSPRILSERAKKLESDLRFISCPFGIDACAETIARVGSWIEQGVDPHKIAVIVLDERYKKLLQISDEAGNFNYAMGEELCGYFEGIESLGEEGNGEGVRGIEESFALLEKAILERLPRASSKTFEKLNALLFDLRLQAPLLEGWSYAELAGLFLQEVALLREDDSHGGKVAVMELLESRGMCFEKVILMGFHQQGNAFSAQDRFLSTGVRQRLGMPTLREKQNLKKHYCLELLKNTQEAVMLFEGENLWQFIYELGIEPEILPSSWSLIQERSLAPYQEDEIEASVGERSFSSTSLQLFAECARKFYFRYILGWKEERENKLIDQGNAIHGILHQSFLESPQNPRGIAMQQLFELIEESQSEQEKLELRIFAPSFDAYLQGEGRAQILALEEEFEFVYTGVRLKGKVDRIDSVDGVLRVIDYKFSKDTKPNPYQVAIYYLYAKEKYGFGEEPEVYLCELKNKGRYKRVEKVAEAIAKLEETLGVIRAERGFGKTEKTSACNRCEYHLLCNR